MKEDTEAAPAAAAMTHPLESFLTCTVCNQYFDDPHVLPCYHRFCKRCLSTSGRCALCRQPYYPKDVGQRDTVLSSTVSRFCEVLAASRVSSKLVEPAPPKAASPSAAAAVTPPALSAVPAPDRDHREALEARLLYIEKRLRVTAALIGAQHGPGGLQGTLGFCKVPPLPLENVAWTAAAAASASASASPPSPLPPLPPPPPPPPAKSATRPLQLESVKKSRRALRKATSEAQAASSEPFGERSSRERTEDLAASKAAGILNPGESACQNA